MNPMDIQISKRIEAVGKPLKDWDISIYRGILTGLNPAFLIDEGTRKKIIDEDPKSDEIIRPIVRGRDISRYVVKSQDVWIILAHNGDKKTNVPRVDINQYPSVKKHLDVYYEKLCSRGDQGDTPYNLRNCAYLDDLFKQKVAWIDLSDRGRFALIDEDTMIANTAFFFAYESPFYLLGVLNSTLISWYFDKICASSGAGTNRWLKYVIGEIPIPTTPPNKKEIERLVRKRLYSDPLELPSIDSMIDCEVCAAYGLSLSESDHVGIIYH